MSLLMILLVFEIPSKAVDGTKRQVRVYLPEFIVFQGIKLCTVLAGARGSEWLKHYAESRKVASSRPDEVN
jgi:hypothetical protein